MNWSKCEISAFVELSKFSLLAANKLLKSILDSTEFFGQLLNTCMCTGSRHETSCIGRSVPILHTKGLDRTECSWNVAPRRGTQYYNILLFMDL
jgi:hypothetical protein